MGGAGASGPQARAGRGAARRRPGRQIVEIGERTPAGDTFTVTLLGPIDALGAARPARRDAAAAVHHPAARPSRTATRRSTPASPGSRPHRRPGCTSHPSCWRGSAASGVEHRQGRAGRRARHVPPGRHRTIHSTTGCTPSATGYPATTLERCRAGQTRRRRRDHHGAGARVGGRDRPSSSGRTEHVHPPRVRLAARRPDDDELPPAADTLLMMIDAFVGERWRDLYDVALDAGYRFLSFGDAMLLDRSRLTDDRRARSVASLDVHPVVVRDDRERRHRLAAVLPRRPTGHVHARRVHAGRHPGRDQVPERRPTTTALGTEIVLGNTYHLMLRPGADDGRPLRRSRPGSPGGAG